MLKTNKITRSVTGKKIKFEGEIITYVTFNGTTKNLKMFVLKNTDNLFGTDWMQQFNLWDQPINTFCQKIESLMTESEKLKKELKETFPEVFSIGFGRCKKMSAKFELKETFNQYLKKKEMCLSPRWKK